MKNALSTSGSGLDLSVAELPRIDLSFCELERIAAPGDATEFVTGLGVGVGISMVIVTIT